jgi:hypothetical protein
MGVRTDRAIWRRPQPAVTADHPALKVEPGTVYSVEDYTATAHRLLYDETFANDVARQQSALAIRLVNGHAYWTQILERYADWLRVTKKSHRPK